MIWQVDVGGGILRNSGVEYWVREVGKIGGGGPGVFL